MRFDVHLHADPRSNRSEYAVYLAASGKIVNCSNVAKVIFVNFEEFYFHTI